MQAEPNSPVHFGRLVAAEADADVIIYNGAMDRSHVLDFVQTVFRHRSRKKLILILVTDGGDPDAAYKMMRYLHRRYDRITVLVAGNCKSAGTLAVIGAHEVAFAPYGELGPLDIQTYKTDNLAGMESGLTITEAIDTLVKKAMDLHREHYTGILTATGRVVSFASAASVATELSTGLFAPIFARIDPYDVGQKARSMRIANSYAERLATVSKNLKEDAVENLTRGYPSHSFVIDMEESQELFNNVRGLTDAESSLIEALGGIARVQFYGHGPIIFFLSEGNEEDGDDAPNAAVDSQRKDLDADRRGAAGEVPDAGTEG